MLKSFKGNYFSIAASLLSLHFIQSLRDKYPYNLCLKIEDLMCALDSRSTEAFPFLKEHGSSQDEEEGG